MNNRLQRFVVCFVVTILVAGFAVFELRRVENGQLFLLAFPNESEPSEVEIADAHDSATENTLPAMGVIVSIGLVFAVSGRSSIPSVRQFSLAHPVILVCFVTSVIGDLLSTMLFFHQTGIENELHPAIRLFGYAYGRTAGPLLGKLIQAMGVLFVAALLGHHGRWLLLLVSVLYAAATGYNLSQSLS